MTHSPALGGKVFDKINRHKMIILLYLIPAQYKNISSLFTDVYMILCVGVFNGFSNNRTFYQCLIGMYPSSQHPPESLITTVHCLC